MDTISKITVRSCIEQTALHRAKLLLGYDPPPDEADPTYSPHKKTSNFKTKMFLF